MVTSSSGFQRHLIPVSELKVINDITSRGKSIIEEPKFVADIGKTLFDLPNPDAGSNTDLVDKLEEINQTLITLTKVINKFNK